MYFLLAAAWSAFALPLASVATVPSPEAPPSPSACAGRTLAGTVQDSTAAVIPGATVEIDENPAARPRPAAATGVFSFPCIAAGFASNYLPPQPPGFATAGAAASQQRLSAGPSRITLIPADSVTIRRQRRGVLLQNPCTRWLERSHSFSGAQLSTLADDPDDLQRELQQLAAAAGGPPSGSRHLR